MGAVSIDADSIWIYLIAFVLDELFQPINHKNETIFVNVAKVSGF